MFMYLRVLFEVSHVQDVMRLEGGVANAALPPEGVPRVAHALAINHGRVDGHGLAGDLVLLEEVGEFDGTVDEDVGELGEGHLAALLLASRRVIAPFKSISV